MTTDTQLELGLRRAAAPTVSEVATLIAWLRGRGWVHARDIAAVHGINDRRMRGIARASDGEIISGQDGYRLLDAETPLGEAEHAAAWLISQGRDMIRRGIAIRRRVHRFGRVAS